MQAMRGLALVPLPSSVLHARRRLGRAGGGARRFPRAGQPALFPFAFAASVPLGPARPVRGLGHRERRRRGDRA
eukprot:7548757-Lingulodinium_polyedra.AAC.1